MAQNANAVVYGTTIFYGTAGGAASTAYAGVKAIRGFPNLNADEIEITRIDQLDAIKQFVAGMAEAGMLQLSMGFKKADVATALGFFRLMKSWKIVFSEASTLTFDGWIKAFGFAGTNTNDEVIVNVDIRVSGTVTFTPGP